MDFGVCNVVVSYDFLQGMDNFLGVNIFLVDGIGSGEVFFVGIIIEFYWVIDVVGNEIGCFFIVIVEDKELFIFICFEMQI